MSKLCFRKVFFLFALVVFSGGLLVVSALSADPLRLVWEGDVFSSGVPVTTSIALGQGVHHEIVVQGTWWYDFAGNLAADAQYYTTDFSNSVFWGNYFAAPGGGSFLQINGLNRSWGPFSNGDSGNHTYTLSYAGSGSGITFRIVDWMDGNYTNNVSHIHIQIFTGVTVGGSIEDSVLAQTSVYIAVGVLIVACAGAFVVMAYQRGGARLRS
jgi:hypothetical protein